MTGPAFDVVVVGAGQAGLGISFFLQQDGVRHIVLERERIGESWRSQRWDSFVLNSPNRFNLLPGDTYRGSNPGGFDTAKTFVSSLEDYVRRLQLPVQEHTRVISVTRDSPGYTVTTLARRTTKAYACRQVVIASGGMNVRSVPPFAKNISPGVRQLHAGEYRAPSDLPDGAVLVVGSAQSGLQVAEDLIEAGKRVYLSTSAVGRVPRSYRGRDILDWLLTVGFYDVKTGDVADPKELELRPPQVSGIGPHGHTHSLQSLAGRGVAVIGRVDGVRGDVVDVRPNAADNVRYSDEVSGRIKALIEQHIAANHLNVPPPDPDPADEPDIDARCASPVRSLDLRKENIRSIIWATGFTGDFSFLNERVIDGRGRPVHRNGISDLPGLYFLGLPWLRKRKSGIVHGVAEDAAFIAERMKAASRG